MSLPQSSPAYPQPDPDVLTLRRETEDDVAWIETLHEIAFGPGRFARAAFRVRERYETDPTLNWVGELHGQRAASVRMTPIRVGTADGYLLGPLMTDPAFRKQGIGRSLVRHVCEIALGREGVSFVLLVGDFAYYGPLGFVPTVPRAIQFPGPVDPERVLVHSYDDGLAQTLSGAIARFRGALPDAD